MIERDGPNHRLDKWLWAARFYKTRALAAEAIAGGKVELNGAAPKRGREVRVGDAIRLRLGPYEHHVVVRALATRRGPAAEAQQLYEESAASVEARRLVAERLRSAPPPLFSDKGRPGKKDRRELRRFKEGEW